MENLSGYVKGVGCLVRRNTYQQCFWRWWFGEGMENEREKMTRPNMCGICDYITVRTSVHPTRYNSG